MIKKKITPLTIFSILVFISIIYFLPVAQGVDFTISDVEDDVLRDCPTEEDTGDYHDEIDKNIATAANIVDDVTEHSVISEIPVAVEEIPGNMKVVAHTSISIFDGCNFSDLTPLPGSDQDIPSYDLFILICITLGISLILIKKYKK